MQFHAILKASQPVFWLMCGICLVTPILTQVGKAFDNLQSTEDIHCISPGRPAMDKHCQDQRES